MTSKSFVIFVSPCATHRHFAASKIKRWVTQGLTLPASTFMATLCLLVALSRCDDAMANQNELPAIDVIQLNYKGKASQAAHDAAEAMGGEQQLVTIYTNNRDALVGLLMKNFHTSETNAAVACDQYVMPALKHHVGDVLNAYALVLQQSFSEAELMSLIRLYKTPVMRKLAVSQADLQQKLLSVVSQSIGPTVDELYAKHGAELEKLGMKRYPAAH